jgi:hypothetical protein
MQLPNDTAGLQFQGGEEGGSSVPFVVVRPAFQLPWAHRQHRLGAIQRLDLALFINTEHHGVIGRIHVQAYNVAYLFDEQWIG